MKNIPRIFIGENISQNTTVPLSREMSHSFTKDMRRNDCLVFGGGREYNAHLSDDKKSLIFDDKTTHTEQVRDITLYFAPIKRLDDLINMTTQLGVSKFCPVITDKTVAAHINWTRMEKIMTEAAEQSNRNSVPVILPAVKFSELDLSKMIFADERAAYGKDFDKTAIAAATCVLIGPEGGFSDAEFTALDRAGATGISLGKNILRAELAAAMAVGKILL